MIRIAEHCGLCVGAERSIEIALAALREAGAGVRAGGAARPVVLYKELLHNATVMEELAGLGARCVGSLSSDEIPDNAIVVVRAHGEGEGFYGAMAAAASSRGVEIRDGTCANVRKIHELVRAAHAEGRAVVILGKRGHAETEGTNGWCGGAAVILESEADVAAMLEPEAEGVLVVAQTTAARSGVERLLALLRGRFPGKVIEYRDTVCAAPLRIHEPSMRLAAECDILFTIGGAKSANTSELRKVCAGVGGAECPPQMESCAEFYCWLRANGGRLRSGGRYGFTAGASTPRKEVEKCRDLLAFFLRHREIKERLEGKMARVNARFLGEENRILREAGEHFADINGGGKYLRGVLAVLGYGIAAGAGAAAAEGIAEDSDEYADPLALAFEVFQTAVLVHDDLIDHDAVRRGKKTIHHRYPAGLGEAMAVCVGDWGLFRSVGMLAEAYGGDARGGDLLRYFSSVIETTIQGEIIDTVLPFEQRARAGREFESSGEELAAAVREIHRRKTACYTTVGPLVCGMILGGASADSIAAMAEFAEQLGLAFQMQDDLLGVFGDAAVMGKSVGSDILEYKQTLLYAYVRVLAPGLFPELQEVYGTAGGLERVREIFVSSGAYARARGEMDACFAAAREALGRAAFLSDEERSVLSGFALYLGMRES